MTKCHSHILKPFHNLVFELRHAKTCINTKSEPSEVSFGIMESEWKALPEPKLGFLDPFASAQTMHHCVAHSLALGEQRLWLLASVLQCSRSLLFLLPFLQKQWQKDIYWEAKWHRLLDMKINQYSGKRSWFVTKG